MLLYIFSALFMMCIGLIIFFFLSPGFGGNPTKEQKLVYQQLNNYVAGKFENEAEVSNKSDSKATEFVSAESDSDIGTKRGKPAHEIPVAVIDWEKINSKEDSITWLGHSSFIISIDNNKLLLDPMLGTIASPVSFTGVKRYQYSESLLELIDKLPSIDAVFISHDHYDHLDYQSILKVKDKVANFYVPLGVSAHLLRWGVPKEKIVELNCREEKQYQGLTVALMPAKHFSGRNINNLKATLWGSWVILGENTRLYYSGDGGYGSHFKEIGEKYGPFELALIDGAQYDRRWVDSHMTPEQSVQANLDVGGKNMMLMHWGAFTLANHNWKEPIERAIKEGEKVDVNLIAPKVGETVLINSEIPFSLTRWWDYL